jgi:endonuclease YncB( thermonuclease family)
VQQVIRALAITAALFISACSMLNSLKPTNEQVRHDPQRTVYRSADGDTNEKVNLPPAQKVPGE